MKYFKNACVFSGKVMVLKTVSQLIICLQEVSQSLCSDFGVKGPDFGV